ncbi:MAG: YcjX family protein [Hyphomicrobiaceae bacterium]
MAITDISQSALGALRSVGAYVTDLATPTVRLGVTGLARSGKTIFITALVRNLVVGGRLSFFAPAAEGRIVRAYLEPQPDDDVPRFAYEEHLASLAAEPPQWPESTRRVSQLRVTIEYAPRSAIKRRLGVNKLHVDIVDYPGEWLIDLPMLDLTFAQWSREAMAQLRDPRRATAAGPFLAFLAGLDPSVREDEAVAIAGAELYTGYLRAARAISPADLTLGPGRFTMPGDHAGSPLLTFFPLDLGADGEIRRGTLAAMMERRYDAYRTRLVQPFFREHFARLDRQIVLVDVLGAIVAGPGAMRDLEASLSTVLKSFRPGASGWLAAVMPRRIDRILFAATKADHIHHTSHDRLEAALATLTRRAKERATFHGAEVTALALAALQATREAEVLADGQALACIVGTPMAGERVGTQVFDGTKAHRVYPGEVPTDVARLAELPLDARPDTTLDLVRFCPVRIAPDTASGHRASWPHIRLDRALNFLLGDRLT